MEHQQSKNHSQLITYKVTPNTKEEIESILNPKIKKWFFCKFKEFSIPQLYSVYEVHYRNNILISAPTGGTKTLSSFLSILNELINLHEDNILQDKVYCVYISPLKALNNDIAKNLLEPLNEIFPNKNPIRVSVRTGDTPPAERQKMLKNPPHILITTPESIAIMLSSVKFKEFLKDVEFCIVDEIHALADNKRGSFLSLSLERLQYHSPNMCRIGLSATISPLEEVAKFLVGDQRQCKIVDVSFAKKLELSVLSPVANIIESQYSDTNTKFYNLLDNLIQTHKTTLIFTNTRSGTERIVHHLKEEFPRNYMEIKTEDNKTTQKETQINLIEAHHGSLSKETRLKVENALKEGKLKAVVCSTSLELGIDIGYIDLVICVSSPKSITRFMQRCGRAGHKLHDTVNGKIIVLDRDDLVECAILKKLACEKTIENIKIPKKPLDVLAQQIFGAALSQVWDTKELFFLIKKSYPYAGLQWSEFEEILSYLSGEFAELEERHIYARIWYDKNKKMLGKKGKQSRPIFMTNIGTIPEQELILVKEKDRLIGFIEEYFLEKLKKNDIFVLGGECYKFLYAKGMTAQVSPVEGKKPTVPSWFSEQLPLTFELAKCISRFRALLKEKFKNAYNKEAIIKFIKDYCIINDNEAVQIYEYFKEQHEYTEIPDSSMLIIEHYTNEDNKKYAIFHSLYGRKVNDALSRALAFVIAKSQNRDVEIGVNDNGFFISYHQHLNTPKLFSLITQQNIEKILYHAIDKSELFNRRFRHCASRAMMILRQYKGKKKRLGKQQVSSMILLSALKRINEDFFIIKEAKRECLEEALEVENAKEILEAISKGRIKLKEIHTAIPSPFSLNLIAQGYTDILKMEDKIEFLKRMHFLTKAKIALKKNKVY